MKNHYRSLIAPAAIIFTISLSSAPGSTVVVDFNGSNPSALFNTIVPGGSGNYGYWLNNAGVLDQAGPAAGGAFNVYNVDRDTPGTVGSPTLQYNTPISTSGIDTFTISGMIKGDFTNPGSGITGVSLGFMQSSWTDFTGATSYIAMKLVGDGTGVRWNSSQWGGNYEQTGTISLNSANWYLTSATFTKSDTAGTWDWATQISDYGTDGTSFSSVVNTASGSFVHSATYDASSLYGGVNIAATSVDYKSTNLDNLTITTIPEPSSYAITAIGLALLAARRRRA